MHTKANANFNQTHIRSFNHNLNKILRAAVATGYSVAFRVSWPQKIPEGGLFLEVAGSILKVLRREHPPVRLLYSTALGITALKLSV